MVFIFTAVGPGRRQHASLAEEVWVPRVLLEAEPLGNLYVVTRFLALS